MPSYSVRQPLRLQLGTSRFERLPPAVVATFADPSWVNLGEPPPDPDRDRARESTGLGARMRRAGRGVERADPSLYRGANFVAYYFHPGVCLPFTDATFTFVFSEHFFEHLFMDEAFELFRECFRVLPPGGVLRTAVPDADLRTYEAPEPVGLGRDGRLKDAALPWRNPNKHKSRWSVHNLPLLLNLAGFTALPLTYCDRDGRLHRKEPTALADSYAGCVDQEMIRRMDYLSRPMSLVVDAIKR